MEHKISIIVEVLLGPETNANDAQQWLKNQLIHGFYVDPEFEAVEMQKSGDLDKGHGKIFVLHGTVENKDVIQHIRSIPEVLEVWGDPRIEGFKPQAPDF